MIEVSVVAAFIAGLFIFLAPCTLPMIPAFLLFISGVSIEEMREGGEKMRIKMILNGFMFVLGFTAVFITYGVLAGFLGKILAVYKVWLARIGGLILIWFGVMLWGWFDGFGSRVGRVGKLVNLVKPGRLSTALVLGMSFGFGWTPCVGPILGSILFLAANEATAIEGGFLLGVFSLGLAVPFILVAAAFSTVTIYIDKITPYLKIVSRVAGAFLIGAGILILTGNLEFWVRLLF